MAYEWAVPGAKCVCVYPDTPACLMYARGAGSSWWPGEKPVRGAIYTLERIWIDDDGEVVGEFRELKRSPRAHVQWGRHVGYGLRRFRPLVTRTQEHDVALFALILHGWPAEVRDHDADSIRDAVDALAKRAKEGA